ncbi:MAG: Tryptophan synthase alpha chain [Methanocella sp. PtaU1.Bin125]|nr:MAG: Tryptophan synthase alpha chain [Methanocella sp. PtaU1.Bin125]
MMISKGHLRLSEQFDRLRSRGEGALIAYITLGDPTPAESLAIAQTLIDSGSVDVLELGVPFSDPIADGPVIQAAVDRALKAGMNTDLAFDIAGALDKKVPVVYLTYYNIVLQYGIERFTESCRAAGVSGLIVADLPFEESLELRAACKLCDVDYIHVVTPNTGPERMRKILADASGFVYLVSTMGVTGKRKTLSDSLGEFIRRGREAARQAPVAVGFGISGPDHVGEVVGMGADGAIVGSAIVDLIRDGTSAEEILAFVKTLKQATRPISAAVNKT